jgi:hypothetical protein
MLKTSIKDKLVLRFSRTRKLIMDHDSVLKYDLDSSKGKSHPKLASSGYDSIVQLALTKERK